VSGVSGVSRRPALRAGALAVSVTLAAFVVVAAAVGTQVRTFEAQRGRASAAAVGTVVVPDETVEGTVTVRWADRAGHTHEQPVEVRDPGRYAAGGAFGVVYDPADPTPRGLPADPRQAAGMDGLVMPVALAGGVAALSALWWASRGSLYLLARRRPGQARVATVLAGEPHGGTRTSPVSGIWIALAEVEVPERPLRWQRVMWHPSLDAVDGPSEVLVHGDPTGRRRVVVELADGTPLVPVGHLRARPPSRMLLTERAGGRADLADCAYLPPGVGPAGRVWWRPGVATALAGAAAGAVLGALVTGGGVGVASFAAGAAALAVNGWGLAGAES
jgi:hypothetical protein